MADFKLEIKAWLKSIGKDRFWLAKNTYASKPTVDGWLASRGVIPPAKQDLIRNLIKQTDKTSLAFQKDRSFWKGVAVILNIDDYNLISKSAKLDKMSIEEWTERELIRAAKKKTVLVSMQKHVEEFKVADEPPAYGSREEGEES